MKARTKNTPKALALAEAKAARRDAKEESRMRRAEEKARWASAREEAALQARKVAGELLLSPSILRCALVPENCSTSFAELHQRHDEYHYSCIPKCAGCGGAQTEVSTGRVQQRAHRVCFEQLTSSHGLGRRRSRRSTDSSHNQRQRRN